MAEEAILWVALWSAFGVAKSQTIYQLIGVCFATKVVILLLDWVTELPPCARCEPVTLGTWRCGDLPVTIPQSQLHLLNVAILISRGRNPFSTASEWVEMIKT